MCEYTSKEIPKSAEFDDLVVTVYYLLWSNSFLFRFNGDRYTVFVARKQTLRLVPVNVDNVRKYQPERIRLPNAQYELVR